MILHDKEARAWLEANSKYFTYRELACKCGCGRLSMCTIQVAKLNTLCELSGGPLVITSFYRCPAHNLAVGGAAQSRHLISDAGDILTPGLMFQDTLLALAKPIFTGIIVYHRLDDVRFIHLDNRPVPYFEDKRQ